MKCNLLCYIPNSRLFGWLNHAEQMPDHASSKAYPGYNCTAGFDLLPIGRGEESLLLQHKYRSGMWLQIQNSWLSSIGWCVENKTQHNVALRFLEPKVTTRLKNSPSLERIQIPQEARSFLLKSHAITPAPDQIKVYPHLDAITQPRSNKDRNHLCILNKWINKGNFSSQNHKWNKVALVAATVSLLSSQQKPNQPSMPWTSSTEVDIIPWKLMWAYSRQLFHQLTPSHTPITL